MVARVTWTNHLKGLKIDSPNSYLNSMNDFKFDAGLNNLLITQEQIGEIRTVLYQLERSVTCLGATL